jgi:hemerythrin-like domain-containing protein
MADIMQSLHQDRTNLGKMLKILEREIAVLEGGALPDLEIIGDILRYCMNYPDKVHHPKEDMVMRCLVDRDGATPNLLWNLEKEHGQLAEITAELHKFVDDARQGGDVDKIRLLVLLQRFVSSYWSHMEMEETQFFPQALKVLGDSDWREVADTIEDPEDPLFDENDAETYQSLRFEILRADGERC